jgi:hypothetical protein
MLQNDLLFVLKYSGYLPEKDETRPVIFRYFPDGNDPQMQHEANTEQMPGLYQGLM